MEFQHTVITTFCLFVNYAHLPAYFRQYMAVLVLLLLGVEFYIHTLFINFIPQCKRVVPYNFWQN